MTAPGPPPNDAGFSLLETLVTLFIVATLATAGASVLAATLDGRERFDAAAERVADLERANAALKMDLAQLVLRRTRDAFGDPRPYVFAGGIEGADAPFLAFARAGRENPDGLEARGSVVYVEYALKDDALVRRMAVRADPARDTPVVETVLLTGVARADVVFGSASSSAGSRSAPGGYWRDVFVATSESDTRLPEAVELTLELEDVGTVRQLFLTSAGS